MKSWWSLPLCWAQCGRSGTRRADPRSGCREACTARSPTPPSVCGPPPSRLLPATLRGHPASWPATMHQGFWLICELKSSGAGTSGCCTACERHSSHSCTVSTSNRLCHNGPTGKPRCWHRGGCRNLGSSSPLTATAEQAGGERHMWPLCSR